jgi:hypothetical protein
MRSARQSGNCFGRALARMYGGTVAEVFGKANQRGIMAQTPPGRGHDPVGSFVGFLACLLGNEPARCDSGDSAVNIQVPFVYENARVFVPSSYTIGERGLMDSAILQNLICDASDD